jgi:hypothetical protein
MYTGKNDKKPDSISRGIPRHFLWRLRVRLPRVNGHLDSLNNVDGTFQNGIFQNRLFG